MQPVFFSRQSDFRKWLEKNHKKETELFVGFYKVNSGKPSLTWPQSVDEALCFGWIDGVRKSINEVCYMIRFIPRKPSSIWSAVNIKKVAELTKKGLMKPEGIASFARRSENRSKVYSFENAEVKLSPDFEKTFKANKKAWNYFQALAPSYRKASTSFVMSAKQEAARIKRLNDLIADSALSKNQWKTNKYNRK